MIGLTARYVSYEGYGEYYNEELKFSDFDQLEGGDGSVCGPCLPFTPPPPPPPPPPPAAVPVAIQY